MDGACRTYGNTLAADAALLVVDIADVVLNLDSLELTLLLALATTDTSGLTSLHGHWAFVLVDTRHVHATTLWTLFAQLDDVAWASLHTGTA